jgi:regulator of cell morphogenesis and NO signaling
MSQIDPKSTVGQLVAEKPSRARVFERLGIDYCCGGKKPLETACQDLGLDPQTVVVTLLATEAIPGEKSEQDWNTAPLSALVDNIISEHHDYLREELPRLSFLTEKVANAHGERYPEMLEVHRVFGEFREHLESHMMKEEMILFPMVRQIEAGDTSASRSHCGSIRNPIFVMEREHDDAGTALSTFRSLTNGYTPPESACNTFRALLDALATLEGDMHRHVHKENNVLFPRAIAAESSMEPALV